MSNDTFKPSEAVKLLNEIEDFDVDRNHAECILMNCLAYLGHPEVADAFFEATTRSYTLATVTAGAATTIDLGDVDMQ